MFLYRVSRAEVLLSPILGMVLGMVCVEAFTVRGADEECGHGLLLLLPLRHIIAAFWVTFQAQREVWGYPESRKASSKLPIVRCHPCLLKQKVRSYILFIGFIEIMSTLCDEGERVYERFR